MVEPADSETWWLKKKTKNWASIRRKGEINCYDMGCQGWGMFPLCYSSYITRSVVVFFFSRFQNSNGLHKRTDMNMPVPLLLMKLRSMELWWKSLMSDHGLRV